MADAKGSFAHLILNPAAGSAAAFLGRLIRAARERGIGVRVLEPGEDARLAALTMPRWTEARLRLPARPSIRKSL